MNACRWNRTMSQATLRQRVERLERIVRELQTAPRHELGPDDWRTMIGAFSADARAKEILDEALRLRESDRQQRMPTTISDLILDAPCDE
jgi:hypothetical protein